jgi:LysR family nitrogen assimilation transcriptional regulator
MSSEISKSSRRVRSTVAELAARGLIDSRRLFYFYHVARSGSFSAAESVLDIAQPAMTRQIQQLEADVGVKLLERTARGVALTGAGRILHRHAEAIFATMSSAIDALEADRRHPGERLSIATPPTFSSMVMPEAIQRMLHAMPDLELSVLEASTGQVHDYLVAGEVDLAVIIHAPNTQRLVLERISTEPLCLIARHDHPIAALPFVPRARLAELGMVVPASVHGSRGLVERYLSDGGITLKPALQVDSLAITTAVLAQTPRFCSILPERACRVQIDAGVLVARPLKPGLQRTLHVARMRERPETPAMVEMTKQIRAVLSGRGASTAGTAPRARRIGPTSPSGRRAHE